MKNIVIFLVFSLLLAACGKNNSTNSGTKSGTNSGTITPTMNTSAVTTSDFANFKTKVINGEFQYPNYTKIDVSLRAFSTSVEKTKFLFIPVNLSNTNYANMTRTDNRSTGVFTHEMATSLTELKAVLTALVNNATGTPNQCGPSCWTFISGGMVYTIDLNYPLIANPVNAYNSSNAGYSLLYWSGIY